MMIVFYLYLQQMHKRKLVIIFMIVFLINISLVRFVNKSVFADVHECLYGCCGTCPDYHCVNFINVNPCQTSCYSAPTCSDGSRRCPSCPSSGITPPQICSPGQWGSCGAQGCPSDHSAQCNSNGTGWSCVPNPGSCSGGGGGNPPPPPPPCVTSNPAGSITIVSPQNNYETFLPEINVNFTSNLSTWGSTCGNSTSYNLEIAHNPNNLDCNDRSLNYNTARTTLISAQRNLVNQSIRYLSSSGSTPANNVIQMNSIYCYRISATHSSHALRSAPRKIFTVAGPTLITEPSFVAPKNMSSADVCGNGIVGTFSDINLRIDEPNYKKTSNPISISFSLSKRPDMEFKDIYLAIVPADNASVARFDSFGNAARYSMDEIQRIVTNAKTILARYSVDTKQAAVYKNGSFVAASINSIKNQHDTAELMFINDPITEGTTNVKIIDNNTVKVTFAIKLLGEGLGGFPSGKMNVYYMSTAVKPDSNAIVASDQVGSTMYFTKRNLEFNTDLIKPNVQISQPLFLDDTNNIQLILSSTDRIYSNFTTLNSLSNIITRLYIQSNRPNTILTRLIGSGQSVSSVIPTDEIYYPAEPHLGFNTSGENQQIIIQINNFSDYPDYRFKLFARDNACNENQTFVNLVTPKSWIMSRGGNTYSNKLITQKIPNLNSIQNPFMNSQTIAPFGFYLNVLSKEGINDTSRISKNNLFSLNYDEMNFSRVKKSTNLSFRDLLVVSDKFNKITHNGDKTILGNSIKNSLNTNADRVVVNVEGNLSIASGVTCDIDSVFFVNGNIFIEPDLLVNDKQICMFYSSNDITIGTGNVKTFVPKNSNDLASYDIVNGILFADNRVILNQENVNPNLKLDGLRINGAIYATQLVNNRDIGRQANNLQPAVIVDFPLHFFETWGELLGKKQYKIREIR